MPAIRLNRRLLSSRQSDIITLKYRARGVSYSGDLLLVTLSQTEQTEMSEGGGANLRADSV